MPRRERISDQQAKIKPILQELHDATLKVVQHKSMSREERLRNVTASREKGDKKIREILDDDQKKKLDQLEQEPHHGNLNGRHRRRRGHDRFEEIAVTYRSRRVAHSSPILA